MTRSYRGPFRCVSDAQDDIPVSCADGASFALEIRVPYTVRSMSIEADTVWFQRASDQSLLIYFSRQITIQAHQQVLKLLRLLESQPIPEIRNLHPAYRSLLIKFDALTYTHDELESALRGYLKRLDEIRIPEPRQVQIPVCYGGDFGPDLNEVAEIHNMTPSQVIELHASVNYIVYFLGFVPGFAYLGQLPDELATPRLATPRRHVPGGTVGIAGKQTAIYPFATPGGWRLIGRTPLAIFRPDAQDMSRVSIGDHVRFMPLSRQEYAAWKTV